MTSALLGVFVANVAYATIGIGLAAMLGVFDRRPATFVSGLIGLPLGMAVALLLSAYAALAGVTVGPTTLSLLAVASLSGGVLRLRRQPPAPAVHRRTRPLLTRLAAVPTALAVIFMLLAAARTTAVKPLLEWDGWVLWATKARVLYEHPGAGAAILRQDFYGAPSYPFGLPALEATTMRAVGRFDGTVLDVQLLLLVAAASGGIWALQRHAASPVVSGLSILATLSSSQIAYQLTTNYADVPVAFLTALAVVAGAVWLVDADERRPWQLACFSVFLAAAAWTKSEGLVFGLAASAALLAAALLSRRGVRAALAAAAAFAVLAAPWRIYVSIHDLRTHDYDLADFTDVAFLRERAHRVGPAAKELLSEMAVTSSWGATIAVIVLSVATALLTRRRLAGVYAGVWLLLSFGGLVATYWISNHRLDNDLENSSYRTIVTLLVTGLCVAPLLLDEPVSRAEEWLSRRRADPGRLGSS